MSTPAVFQHDDGTCHIDWGTPDGSMPAGPIMWSAELLAAAVDRINKAVAMRALIVRVVDELQCDDGEVAVVSSEPDGGPGTVFTTPQGNPFVLRAALHDDLWAELVATAYPDAGVGR